MKMVEEWMDRWMDGWMDGWMNGWMDGWIDDGQMDRICVCIDRQSVCLRIYLVSLLAQNTCFVNTTKQYQIEVDIGPTS